MTDGPDLTVLPTAEDKLLGSFEEIKRLLPVMMGLAPQIAAMRKTLYDAYVAEGFTKEQALELCKSITL